MRLSKIWIHAVLVGLLGLAVRVYQVGAEPPGFEEMAAVLASRSAPTHYLPRPSRHDFCPPVFYLVSKPLAATSRSLSPPQQLPLMRTLSLISGALLGVFILATGRIVLGEKPAMVTAYLVALHPLHVFYSQEFQPFALASIAAFAAYYYCVRSAETNRNRHWILFDVSAFALLHCARGTLYLVFAFLLIHLSRALLFPYSEEPRNLRRGRLLQAIGFNYLIVFALSLPWLFFSHRIRLPWDLARPDVGDVFQIFAQHFLTGAAVFRPFGVEWLLLLLYLLLVPPLIRAVQEFNFRGFAITAVIAFCLVLSLFDSILDRSRFEPLREAMVLLPFFLAGVGALIARCNFYVRAGLISVFCVLFLAADWRQARTSQKLPFDSMRIALAADAKPQDAVAFWPDYTDLVGDYINEVYGNHYRVGTTEDVLARWGELPRNKPIYFMVSQFSTNKAHLYTFRAALQRYSKSNVLWPNATTPAAEADSLNAVIRATQLDRPLMRRWWEDPRSLEIVDVPTSETMFLFTPTDPPSTNIFNSTQFHLNRLDASYDRQGRRVVWTAQPRVELQLPVMLEPGSYTLRVHCAPDFDAPARLADPAGAREAANRSVDLGVRVFTDERRLRLDRDMTIKLHFATEVELRTIPLHIDVSPMVHLRHPDAADFGLKVYSIAVDMAGNAPPE